MASVAIGTAGAISAYFFGRAFSSHGLNESDPIKGLLLPLSYCLPVFGCGLVFWLLVLLWPKLRYTGVATSPQKDIGEVATLNTALTAINLWGCLALARKQQLPLLVHFLMLFQLSSNLALLLIWASTLFTTKTDKRIADTEEKIEKIGSQQLLQSKGRIGKRGYYMARNRREMRQHLGDRYDARAEYIERRHRRVIEAVEREESGGGSGGDGGGGGGGEGRGDPEHGREESGGGSGGDGGGGGGGEGRGDPEHGREESGGGSGTGGDGGGGGGGEGRGDPEHGREESGGGSGGDGGGGGGGEGRRDPEHGVTERKNESSFKVSKMSEMSIMLTAQTSAAVIGFHLTSPSFSTKVLFVLVMVDQLVGYLCGLTAMLLQLQNQNQNPRAARVFANVGFACTGLGYILMTAMFLDWYLVLIAVLFVGIFSIIFSRRLPRLIARLTKTYS